MRHLRHPKWLGAAVAISAGAWWIRRGIAHVRAATVHVDVDTVPAPLRTLAIEHHLHVFRKIAGATTSFPFVVLHDNTRTPDAVRGPTIVSFVHDGQSSSLNKCMDEWVAALSTMAPIYWHKREPDSPKFYFGMRYTASDPYFTREYAKALGGEFHRLTLYVWPPSDGQIHWSYDPKEVTIFVFTDTTDKRTAILEHLCAEHGKPWTLAVKGNGGAKGISLVPH